MALSCIVEALAHTIKALAYAIKTSVQIFPQFIKAAVYVFSQLYTHLATAEFRQLVLQVLKSIIHFDLHCGQPGGGAGGLGFQFRYAFFQGRADKVLDPSGGDLIHLRRSVAAGGLIC